MRIALFEPEIAGNVGAVLRLAACMGLEVDLIEPMGFTWDDARVRRTAMDYIDHVTVHRHADVDRFLDACGPARLILSSSKAALSPYRFTFRSSDILLFGKESAGVPDWLAERCDERLRMPMRPGLRSLNVATCAAMVVGEALRQTGGLPG